MKKKKLISEIIDNAEPVQQINTRLRGSTLMRLNFLARYIYSSKTQVIIAAIDGLYWKLKNEGKLEPENWEIEQR